MDEIKIKGFVFEVDIEETKKTHNKRTPASAECSCEDCKDYNKNREIIFPKKLKPFLKKFGIDYKKEDYIATYNVNPDLRNVDFYVRGRLIKRGKSEYLFDELSTRVFIEDKDIPSNFVPDGLSKPYFIIAIWLGDKLPKVLKRYNF